MEDVELLAGRLEVRQEAGQSHLVISQLHPHDGGVYVCLLSNQHGRHEAAQAELAVLEAATVVFTPSQVNLSRGRRGVVPCYIKPSFYHVSWTRDNVSLHSLTSDPDSGLYVDGETGFLILDNVTRHHQGDYHCQAFNRMGTSGNISYWWAVKCHEISIYVYLLLSFGQLLNMTDDPIQNLPPGSKMNDTITVHGVIIFYLMS